VDDPLRLDLDFPNQSVEKQSCFFRETDKEKEIGQYVDQLSTLEQTNK